MLNRNAPAGAMLSLFSVMSAPMSFDELVDLVADLWDISDTGRPGHSDPPAALPTALETMESRQFLTRLWTEIRALREPQRAALLLNLRDDGGGNALAHLVSSGIVTPDAIGDALGVARERLAAIWDDLPIEDVAIAEILQLTRQQVVNLRKSARERLARRMKRQP
jgi:hypothetical protein